MATTLDQVIAKFIGQDTPLPSLELASETTVQVAAGGGGGDWSITCTGSAFLTRSPSTAISTTRPNTM